MSAPSGICVTLSATPTCDVIESYSRGLTVNAGGCGIRCDLSDPAWATPTVTSSPRPPCDVATRPLDPGRGREKGKKAEKATAGG